MIRVRLVQQAGLSFLCLFLAAAHIIPAQEKSLLSLEGHPIYGHRKADTHQNLYDYPYNPHVPIDSWEELKPYFLPFHHPIRALLDKIFQAQRATLSRENFIEAGFEVHAPKGPSNLVVGKHPLIKGFLIKAFFDVQCWDESPNFMKRIEGARSIQKYIQSHHYPHLFRVPKKWLYPLPLSPSLQEDPLLHRKNFILIVEDMNILSHSGNNRYFREKMTLEMLEALYRVITDEGLLDSVHRGNIPFNRAGKINFIDTEHHHCWPIKYESLMRYLSPEMQSYWLQLTTSHSP